MTFEEAVQIIKQTTPLRITLSGDIGAGKSTFAKRFAEEFNVPRVYIGQLMREEAARRGITLQELHILLEQDPEIDRQMDALQTQKGEETERGVFEGRTAWHFIKESDIDVYFTVDPVVAVERVFAEKDNPLRDKFDSKEALLAADEARTKSNQDRFKKFYGIDIRDMNNFDLVIDTSKIDADEVYRQTVVEIAEFLESGK